MPRIRSQSSSNVAELAWQCGNGVGIEIYQFMEPKTTLPAIRKTSEFEYTRGGFFHIAITVADPEAVKKCIENGGRQFGETAGVFGEKALYAADPWGNVVELLSCSLEQLMSNRN
ncbi:uncharacterized protein N7500_001669 [Penicillium coprophilum]|uniref:uncharacterized protein n=1 Tax=Penicillium coprophilum TaxID=36646 RepID=UPI0023A110C0|nr:uncharacterized protein N7500_001669 [Penicillium coprophilum]KAJ5173738.1 hypothetical protein N7500_001669 [Penicillium coprophilum]